MMSDFFSRYEFFVYLAAAILIANVYLAIRRSKLNRLLKKNGATKTKTFRFGAETLLAVSEEGIISGINFKLETLTFDMKDIAEFEIVIGKYCIANAKASKNDGLLFSGIAGRIKPILAEEKVKEILFLIKLKQNRFVKINLFKSSMLKKLAVIRQDNIVQFFEILEALEKRIKNPAG